jgi:hypothetical protein
MGSIGKYLSIQLYSKVLVAPPKNRTTVCTDVPPGAISTVVFTIPQSDLLTLTLDVAATLTSKPNSSGRKSYSVLTALIVIGLPLG